jgi:hypothetical protein
MIVTDEAASRQLTELLLSPTGPIAAVLGSLGNSVELQLKNLLIQAMNRCFISCEAWQTNSFIHSHIATSLQEGHEKCFKGSGACLLSLLLFFSPCLLCGRFCHAKVSSILHRCPGVRYRRCISSLL